MATNPASASPAKIFGRSTGEATWLGRKQRDALEHLSGAARVKILIGPPSSGKSSILKLFEQQSENAVLLKVRGPQRSALEVLSALLTAAELGLWTLSETEQRNLLTVFIEQRSVQGSRVVICVDNVSQFSAEAWSEIERLTQLRYAGRPIVELVIAARESDASRAPLDYFIQNSCTCPTESIHFISAPDGQDLEGYISWRLARFGIHSTLTAKACAAIASSARGRFSSVNLICQCLFLNRSAERPVIIDEEAVAVAVSKLSELRAMDGQSTTQKLRRLGSKDTPALPAGKLVVTVDGKTDREMPLTGTTVIGRSGDVDLRLNSRLVSRRHAAIVPTMNDRYAISDLDSKNGVLVNGKFVKRAVLYDGDVIDIGEFRVRVELQSPARAAGSSETLSWVDDCDTDIMPAPDFYLPGTHEAQGG
ncbi:MAG TPA: FHA domain-containing protein [Gammaproteobacteria bacterium]|nr:FHA domain-containing protein [Gammaproteobacteria bacterium]